MERLAERFQPASSHPRQVARLALRIFDAAGTHLGLRSAARELLEYAALLHDIGRAISHTRHHLHSSYLIANGNLRGFEPEEISFIALVARLHRGAAPKASRAPLAGLSRTEQKLVAALAVILRLADGLDRGHQSVVTRMELACGRSGFEAAVTVRHGDVLAEWWATQRNAAAWERCLELPLIVRFICPHIEIVRPRHWLLPTHAEAAFSQL